MKKCLELKGLLRERELNYSKFAQTIGMSGSSFSHKLNGKSSFTCEEVNKIINTLQIDREEIPRYFF